LSARVSKLCPSRDVPGPKEPLGVARGPLPEELALVEGGPAMLFESSGQLVSLSSSKKEQWKWSCIEEGSLGERAAVELSDPPCLSVFFLCSRLPVLSRSVSLRYESPSASRGDSNERKRSEKKEGKRVEVACWGQKRSEPCSSAADWYPERRDDAEDGSRGARGVEEARIG
jgi:hypothetical protein